MHEATHGPGTTAPIAAAPPGVAPLPVGQIRLVRDAHWWPAVAALVRDLAAAEAPGDLRRMRVIVPRPLHAPLLRRALHTVIGGACIAPRIQTLEQWTGVQNPGFVRHRAELFEALRGNAWVRERFGANASALWALARDVALLSDELTLAACGAVEAFTGRWRAAAQRHFSQRALAAGEPQSQLVLALWRASLDPQRGADRWEERLAQCAARVEGPLVWLLPHGAAPWQAAFGAAVRVRSGHPAVLVVGDDAALAQSHPLLGAAWPELADPHAEPAPIGARAAALGHTMPARAPAAGGLAGAQLAILRCNSLETEACAAAAWTVAAVRDGCTAIALVALDRMTARRVRALLDRAGIAVADEAGWKLSTTSAAAALMRWIDLVLADFAHAELLDWLQSPFTLGGPAGLAGPRGAAKDAAVALIGAALRDDAVHASAAAVRAALARRALRGVPGGAEDPVAADALHLIESLLACARIWQQAGSLGRYLGLLDTTIDQLGMRAPLAADPVGSAVLEAVGELRDQLAGAALPVDLAEFRAFLAGHLEELGTGAGATGGPVVMTTLAGTQLRGFDAALLIGADADHLPGGRAAGGLLANAVRRELGLPSDAQREAEQMADLASLLAATPRMAATWRQRDGDAPRPLAPLLDRLALLSELCGAGQLLQEPSVQLRSVAAAPSPVRAPRAPGALPARVSATAYQDLVDCPYRFFALRMLGLRPTERLRLLPDKRDLGQALHRIWFLFERDRAGAGDPALPGGGSPDPLAQALHATIDAHFAPLLRQQPALIAYRQRLRQLVPGYLQWLREDARLGWRWQAGEVPLQRHLLLAGAAVPPNATVPEPLAQSITLFGRADRIDAGPGGLRILDFKARDAATLRRAQKDPGEAVQLLFYGLLLDPPASEAAYLSLQPPREPRDPAAGVARAVAAPAPFVENVAQLEERLRADLLRIGAGAPLPASGAETVCRRCELRSLCRHGFTADAPAAAPGVAARDPGSVPEAGPHE
jgi:ATP-dependent helicase/nuclease subunit B